MATNPDVERGLRASVRVFDFATAELGKKQDAVTVDREQLVELKRAAAAMNRSITRFAKEAFATENRLVLEVHMLRGIMHRENTDRDANRARVFELFRRHSGGGDDGALAVSNAAAGTNPLTSPSSAAIAVDRALASLDRIEKGVRDLSPTGTLATHGAGLLSAKTTRDARLAATGKRART